MKRGAIIGIIAAAVVVVAGGAVAAWLLTRPQSPETAAADYLRALSKGDFAAVDAVLVSDSDPARLKSAFSGASTYISDYSVTISGDSDAARTARATVHLGDTRGVVTFGLVRHGGAWKVTDALGSLDAKTTIGDSVTVGGELVKAATPIALLPAVYPVAAAPAGILSGGTSAAVTNEKPVTVTVDAKISPAATQSAQQQLNAYADACAKRATSVPDHCGLRVPWGADLATLSSIAFRIDRYPVLTLAADGTSFNAVDGKIVATAQGTTRNGTAGTFTYSADDWALRGSMSFADDQMVLSVR